MQRCEKQRNTIHHHSSQRQTRETRNERAIEKGEWEAYCSGFTSPAHHAWPVIRKHRYWRCTTWGKMLSSAFTLLSQLSCSHLWPAPGPQRGTSRRDRQLPRLRRSLALARENRLTPHSGPSMTNRPMDNLPFSSLKVPECRVWPQRPFGCWFRQPRGKHQGPGKPQKALLPWGSSAKTCWDLASRMVFHLRIKVKASKWTDQ